PSHITIRSNGEVGIELAAASPAGATAPIREPRYYPSEVFDERRGEAAKVHLASDIYALGFIFYEVLLGAKLFNQQFASVIADRSDFQWLRWHGDLTKRAHPLAGLRADCPVALSRIVDRMIEKRAELRPANLAEVASALQKAESGMEPTERLEPPIVPPPAPVLPFSWKRPAPLAIGGAMLLVVLAGIFGSGNKSAVTGTASDQTAAAPAATAPGPTEAAKPLALAESVETPSGTMMLVPAGEFVMGRNADSGADSVRANETPAHKVNLPPFYIDKHEVTNAQYKKFCDAAKQRYPANPPWDWRYFNKPDHPVMNVSWESARAYAEWAGKRLPTEAEWEKAARGADGRSYPWGNWFTEDTSNLKKTKRSYTAQIGWFPFDASPFQVMDMSGNVPEWVADNYSLYPGNTGALTPEEAAKKVVRGGGFQATPEQATTTFRTPADPKLATAAFWTIGFRCAANPEAVVK
ncbi:MAG: SUMF1/EgtB/PvdO family nonheme iron enzyme, partial [Bryobacteraceae bacterium]